MIRPAAQSDAARILEIYRLGVETRNATFETSVPAWEEWDARHHPFCRYVYVDGGRVIGWGAISPVSKRACYRGVAEISIYVDTAHLGKGIGARLMQVLIDETENHGIWTLYSSIFPENEASYKLHLSYGFREVGYRERIAQLDGKWRNTVILERRSTKAGI